MSKPLLEPFRDDYRGPIRFVRGPLHNRHIQLDRWDESFRHVDGTMSDGVLIPRTAAVVYELHRLTTYRGAIYFEYHLKADRKARRAAYEREFRPPLKK